MTMCKCTPEIRTPFCGRGDCLPPGYANLGEWLGISSDAEAEAAAQASLDRVWAQAVRQRMEGNKTDPMQAALNWAHNYATKHEPRRRPRMTSPEPLTADIDRQLTLLRLAARVDPHLRQAVADVEDAIAALKGELETAKWYREVDEKTINGYASEMTALREALLNAQTAFHNSTEHKGIAAACNLYLCKRWRALSGEQG